MKHLVKLACLGAALVAAPLAHADLLTGSITFTNDPIYFTFDGGSNQLTVYYVSPNPTTGNPSYPQPVNTSGRPALGDYYSSAHLDVFSTTSPVGTTIFTANNTAVTPTDTETFTLTGVGPVTSNSGLYTFRLLGDFTSSTPDYDVTHGYDDVTINTNGSTTCDVAACMGQTVSTGSITEVLTAQTPEPSSLVLLGSGLVSAGGLLMRRRKLV